MSPESDFRAENSVDRATSAQASDSDPTQLILPEVDTSIDLWRGMTAAELLPFAPAAIGAGAVILTGPMGLGPAWYFPVAVLFAMVASAAGVWASVSTAWYETPGGKLREWVDYRRLRYRLPLGDLETVDETHGVERITADGSVVTQDGRRVALLAVSGTNTDRLSAGEEGRLVGRLTEAIDEGFKDFGWRYVSQSRRAETAALAEQWEQRAAMAHRHDLTDLQQEILFDAADWLRDRDAEWDANAWYHYIEVSVSAAETGVEPVSDRIRRALPLVSGPAREQTTAEEMAQLLDDRVREVQDALAGVEGVDAKRAGPRALAEVGLHYWSADTHALGADLVDSFAEARDYDATPAAKALAPDGFDIRGSTVELEHECARTFWVSEWPTEPRRMFLGDLFTTSEADVDVKIYAEPRRPRTVQDALEKEIASIDSEGMERADNMDVSALSIDNKLDAYILAHGLLEEANTQPWRLNGYVTVRAADEDTLNDACAEIRRTLEASPANALPMSSRTRQRDAFVSAAPFTRDIFAENAPSGALGNLLPALSGTADRRRLCLGGALGAMFPFGAPTLDEDRGIRWGRNTLTGETLRADPFGRGTAPHMITLGKSRSGKTYGISTALAMWFLGQSDRTLIVCDTQGGFEGLTQLCDGDHIVVDGSRGINPLDIRQLPPHERRGALEVDPYRMKIDEASEFICGILRSQGVDAAPYRATIEEALEETYQAAGITTDPETHGRDSPTLADFVDVLVAMLDEPEAYTWAGHQKEAEVTEERVANLLDRLSSFREGGKFESLVGETETGLSPDTDMAYLDLRQQQGENADRSVMLHLMLSQVSQLIKQTEGEVVFAIDEAHHLLHSEEMVEWLQQAAREWARYDAALHFISQSPQEFVRRSASTEAGQENHRQTLVEQSSIIQVFSCASPQTGEATLRELGLDNPQLIRAVKSGLTPGKAGKGYSECLLQFSDQRGWIESHVEAPPLLDEILTWSPREHGDFAEFVGAPIGEDAAGVDRQREHAVADGGPSEEGEEEAGTDD